MTKKLTAKYDCACKVDGCGQAAKKRALCVKHYQRMRATGSPTGLTPRAPSKAYAWLVGHSTHVSSKCLQWPFAANDTGYGVVGIPGQKRTVGVHREMCLIAHGAPPSDRHQAAHSCGNPGCVNPSHLRWATPAENMADTLVHGTDARGHKSALAKLTDSQAIEAGRLAEEGVVPQRKIAARFGVSQQVVSRIKLGLAYPERTNAGLIAFVKAKESKGVRQ